MLLFTNETSQIAIPACVLSWLPARGQAIHGELEASAYWRGYTTSLLLFLGLCFPAGNPGKTNNTARFCLFFGQQSLCFQPCCLYYEDIIEIRYPRYEAYE
jgi:hypothetical protein